MPHSSDLGAATLALEKWTDEQRSFLEAAAENQVRKHVSDDHLRDALEMLGLMPYVSVRTPKKEITTPIPHGRRSGYTNRGCGRPGSPPCPATPSCKDMNNAWWRDRRAGIERTAA